MYRPAENQRVPTLEEHFIQAQDQTNPLPIWRPEIKLDCRHDDLTEEEYLQLLDFFRCCLMVKKAIQGEKIRNSDNVDVSQKDI